MYCIILYNIMSHQRFVPKGATFDLLRHLLVVLMFAIKTMTAMVSCCCHSSLSRRRSARIVRDVAFVSPMFITCLRFSCCCGCC